MGGGKETHCETSWCVARDGPTPATVEGGTLLHEDADDATSTERLRVHLPLDLEGVEGEQDLRAMSGA